MAEEKDEKNFNCFNIFFNLIISQLFIGAIASIIEVIRILTFNVLSKYIISEKNIRNYGIYIQPILTSILLFTIGYAIFYFTNILHISTCSSMNIFSYLLFFVLLCILFVIIFFVCIYFYRYFKKKNILENREKEY